MKNKRIHIKVSESDHKAITDRAAELNLTISEYLRRLVIADIAKAEK
jgi:predicted DNA binding CopG/RHH family protein